MCRFELYLAERAQRFGVSKNGFWQALRRLNVSRKKTLHHPKTAERRRREFRHATQRCRRPIVYIDEGGFANDTIARLHRGDLDSVNIVLH